MRLHTPLFNEWLAFDKEAQALERKVWASARRDDNPAIDDIAAIAGLRRKQASDLFEGAMHELYGLACSSSRVSS
jgi:hypothetical protein